MYSANDILFPHRIIATLKHQRGPVWQALVERICQLPETHEETIAFMLMMVELDGCLGCETDSYRAMRGCAACAQQTLRRYKESDESLLARYQETLARVRDFAEDNPDSGIIKPDTDG